MIYLAINLLSLAAYLVAQALSIDAFSFNSSTATECDPLTVNWQGGTPPFTLLITPAYGTPKNYSIPDVSYNSANQSGTFTIPQLPLATTQKFVLTMSDTTGFGSGGNSAILQPGSRVGPSACNTKMPDPDFFFDNNDALTQCLPYRLTNYPNATQPITVMGIIPLGDSFVFYPPVKPKNATLFTWIVNIPAGTTVLILMIDAAGRQGGASDIMTVTTSDDKSCLSGTVYSSTAAAPASTVTAGFSPSQSHTSALNPSTIIGGAIGGAAVLFIVVVGFIAFCIRAKRRKRISHEAHGVQRVGRADGRISLTEDPHEGGGGYALSPYIIPPVQSGGLRNRDGYQLPYSDTDITTTLETAYSPYDPYGRSTTFGTDAGRKPISMSASQTSLQNRNAPALIVRHTDAEQEYSSQAQRRSEEPQILELPPEYPQRAVPHWRA